MTTLADLLLAPGQRDVLVKRTGEWVERYVHDSSGLRGMALKAGLAAAKAARPDAVTRAVNRLLPEFANALEPYWQRFQASGEKDFAVYLKRHARQASADMMAATDARIAGSPNKTLHAGYKRLRGTLAAELEKLLPDIARMIGNTLR
jgi:hypothetical protein